ncbi:hypothetical protein M0805_009028 [Coniferiporia weirii]|nr:hypothetical protein M0805_009028 [Coniferiporia weirii]
MPRNLPPHELYSNKLTSLYLGYALFEPNPHGIYDMVRVGDVGYIEDGKFVKLFNAFHRANAYPANSGSKFPTNFKPIVENHRDIDELESLDPGIRQSTHVQIVGGDLTVSGPAPSAVLVGTGLRLTCGSEGGATLITKYHATRRKAMSSRGMLKYMLDNHTSWLQLVRDLGRPVEMHDLVFVKECILTGDWATILWNEVSYDAEVSFSINASASSLDEICDLLLKTQGLSIKTNHETESDGIQKVGRINWENFNPATSDKLARDAPHDVVVLDELFNKIQLPQESTTATSEITPERGVALGKGRLVRNHSPEVRLIEQTSDYDRQIQPLDIKSKPGIARGKDSDRIPDIDSLDDGERESDSSEEAHSVHLELAASSECAEVDLLDVNPSMAGPISEIPYVSIPKPVLRPRRESMEELRGKLHHERSLHPGHFLRGPSGDLTGRLVYTRSDPLPSPSEEPDWGYPPSTGQPAAITEEHPTAASSRPSSSMYYNITDIEADISQLAEVDNTQFEVADADGNTKNSKATVQGPQMLRGLLSRWWK